MRSPVTWFGGKGQMTKKLMSLIPEHYTYVEPFGGGASLLFAKEPSPVEVYNDLNLGLVSFFRVLRDPEKFRRFYKLARRTPYARAEYDECRRTWTEQADEVERAYRWFVAARMSFGGHFDHGFGTNISTSCNGMASKCSSWTTCLKALPACRDRMMRVQIENQDWRTVLERYDTPETFFYLDPPYIASTRKSGGYEDEMTDRDHIDLIDAILNIRGKVLLSGYRDPIHERLDASGWRRHEWETACYVAGRTRATRIKGVGSAMLMHPRIESAWRNYELGCASFREQEDMF